MKQGKNISFEILTNRGYGPGFAQNICDQIKDLEQREINVFDILELNNLAHDYKIRIKELIAVYRDAQGKKDNGSEPRRVYANWEIIFMRRQISDLWALFQMTRADSRELTKEYERRLKAGAYTIHVFYLSKGEKALTHNLKKIYAHQKKINRAFLGISRDFKKRFPTRNDAAVINQRDA